MATPAQDQAVALPPPEELVRLETLGVALPEEEERVTCEDCGDQVEEWDVTDDGYCVCEHCWNARAREVREVDAGEQENDFAAEESEDSEDEYEDEAYIGTAAWWADGVRDTVDSGAYALLMSSGDHW